MGKGRTKRNDIWRHYRVGVDKSTICKHCDHKYKVANVNKMGGHLIKCNKCPDTVKNEIKKQLDERSTKIAVNASNTIELMPEATPDPRSDLQNQIQPSTSEAQQSETLTEENRDSLVTKFAKAIFVSGSPLSLVEHPLWVDFFKDLEPSFKLPSRKSLATTQLDRIYTDVKKEVTDNLKATNYLHLQCDGWSNVKNEGVINFIITKPEPYFVESLSTEDNRHTSLYLSKEIIKIMKTYGESKFVVLIGDNARNIQKAFELVKNKYPKVVPLNCAAHTLNLLAHDIIKCEAVKGFIDLATEVIKSIKKSQVLTSILNKIIKQKKVGETLKLPAKTRWGSHVAALKSLKNTKAALMTLAIHEENSIQVTLETKSALLDDSFWCMLEYCIAILEPVTNPIFKLETNECNIHTLYMTFKDVKSKLGFVLPTIPILSDEDKDRIFAAVSKRTKDCIKPIHLAAYLLDPKNQGLGLCEDEDLEAMNFIDTMAENLNINVMTDLANYKARDGYWSKRFIWKNVEEIKPVTWWKGICSSTKLSKVAIRILTAPCTSAATERSFSKHGNIHTLKRNRLTAARAAKIAFISYNWDLLHKLDANEDYTDEECQDIAGPSIENESEIDEVPTICAPTPTNFDFEFLNCDNLSASEDDDEDLNIF